jgi:hypothetical protein
MAQHVTAVHLLRTSAQNTRGLVFPILEAAGVSLPSRPRTRGAAARSRRGYAAAGCSSHTTERLGTWARGHVGMWACGHVNTRLRRFRIAELLRTRCSAGWLIITEETVRIEREAFLGVGGYLEVLPRSTLVGATVENTIAPVLSKDGGATLTLTAAGGALLQAKLVHPEEAQPALALLGFA